MVRLFILPALPLLSLQAVDFNKEVRPLLASKCYACHGPDEEGRKAKLRLDLREGALKNEVIVPGKVEESEFHYRIRSDDPEEIMPPPESHATLTEKEKDLLEKWIKEGAEYDKHWAFVPPVASDPPAKGSKWVRNGIDSFILANLEKQNLKPAKQADGYSLVRRLYLDLVGLPPTPEQADAFVSDKRPDAYERLVDELLASPHYGEKWGREWLDLARYADSNGYEKDRPRNIWPYRDWVIRALNGDMPYDQFTIEQLAGDMLPDATQEQKTATGFHRNTQLNEEGGIDPLEFRFYAAVDRVATTGTVWMGLTTGCAQCHTHKYDPITHDEYFGLMALLDNVDEPDLFLETEAQALQAEQIQSQIETKSLALQKEIKGFEQAFEKWRAKEEANATLWATLLPSAMKTNLPKLEVMEDGSIFSSGDATKRDAFDLNFTSKQAITALRLEVLPDDRLPPPRTGPLLLRRAQGRLLPERVHGPGEWGKTKDTQPIEHLWKNKRGRNPRPRPRTQLTGMDRPAGRLPVKPDRPIIWFCLWKKPYLQARPSPSRCSSSVTSWSAWAASGFPLLRMRKPPPRNTGSPPS